jgi:hypothetical protein
MDKDGKLNFEETMKYTSLRAYFLASDWYDFNVITIIESISG